MYLYPKYYKKSITSVCFLFMFLPEVFEIQVSLHVTGAYV